MSTAYEQRNVLPDRSTQTHGVCEHQADIDAIRSNLNLALMGKSDVVELVLTCLLGRGHLLFDDLPGLGKTTLAKALARAVGGKFSRVQCTPDLLPGDITGFNLFNQKSREFEFRSGPVFSDVLLADEINRTTPRTQSALFEAMAERQVSIDGETFQLSKSFFVIATQNPLDSHGTYPLPEAQLDRFAMKLQVGLPDRQSELAMLSNHVGQDGREPASPAPVIGPGQLQALQAHVANVAVTKKVQEYLLDLADATRNHRDVRWGLSPRGVLTWQRMAQAWAHLKGRDFVTPDDVQHVAKPVLGVRLSGDFDSSHHIIEQILSSISVPVT